MRVCVTAILNFLVRVWHRWFPSKRAVSFSGVVCVGTLGAAAIPIKKKLLVLIGPEERPKWLRFICPCGCGEELALNLMKSHRPCWTVTLHEDQTVTVHPSVDATKCRAHFWIRQNQIEWC